MITELEKREEENPETKKELSLLLLSLSLSPSLSKNKLLLYAFFTQSAIAAARYGALAALRPAREILPSLVM